MPKVERAPRTIAKERVRPFVSDIKDNSAWLLFDVRQQLTNRIADDASREQGVSAMYTARPSLDVVHPVMWS